MNEPQARPATALLARKGLAAPVGAASDAAPAPALAPVSESLPEVVALVRAGALPPASLLPLDFLAGRQGARDAAPRPPDPPEVAVVPTGVPALEPEAKLAPGGTGVPELSAKPEVPRPDPTLRIDAGAGPVARAEPRRFPALAAGLALALGLGAVGAGYQSGWFVSQPPERSQAPAAAAQAPAQTQREQTQPEATDKVLAPADQPAEASQPAVPEQPSVDVVRIEPDGAAVIAGRAAPGTEWILLDNGTPIGTVAADAYGEWVFIATSPLPRGAHDFGLVIKEVRGGVRVPAPGQAPAKQDRAERVAAPGVPGINEPGTVASAAATVPIPPRKPDPGTRHATGAPTPAFVVQLASVKSRTGAQREWRALRARFPEILSQMSLSLDAAKLAGGATVVRLRTGAFPKQAEAAALCARLAAKHQDCLVVRTTAPDGR
jgi:hypothetical protein